MNTTAKISGVVACLVFAAGVLQTHHSGALYPGIVAGGILASVVLFFGLSRGSPSAAKIIAAFVSLGVAYRVYSYLFPASMMGFDPDAYAVQSQVIISNGGLAGVVGEFYRAAALFSVSGAEASLVTGLAVNKAYVMFPIAISIAGPLFVGVIVRRITDEALAIVSAVGAITLCASLIQYSNGPIPITLAAVYFAAFVFVLVHSAGSPSWRQSILSLLFVLAGAFTHKIVVLLMAGTLVVLYAYSTVSVRVGVTGSRPHTALLALTGLVLLVTQWSFLTSYFASAIALTFGVLKGLASFGGISPASPTAATRVTPGLPVKILRVSYYFLSMALGALCGVILFKHYKDGRVRSLQSAAVASTIFTLPGIAINAAPGFQRVYVYAAIPVAALIGVLIGKFPNRTMLRGGVGVGVVILLIVNPLAAAATPDQPGTPREYLTIQEVSAKTFGNEYVTGVVHADLFYGDEAIDFPAAAAGSTANQRQVPQPRWRPELIDSGLKNGTLLAKGYEIIAYRTTVETYRLTGGWYRLTWNPKTALDRNCHAIYNDGGVVMYRCPG